jgi:hypothetical protein
VDLYQYLSEFFVFVLGWTTGILTTVLTGVVTGFSKGFGSDLYSGAKKIILREPTLVEVDRRFEPIAAPGEQLAWISESKKAICLKQGYRFRFEDAKRTVYYRKTSDGRSEYSEYLMIKPDDRK